MSEQYLAALADELDQCERAGKTERVKAIKAEIARVRKQTGRKNDEPETAAPSK